MLAKRDLMVRSKAKRQVVNGTRRDRWNYSENDLLFGLDRSTVATQMHWGAVDRLFRFWYEAFASDEWAVGRRPEIGEP